jgi:hypothetical protein
MKYRTGLLTMSAVVALMVACSSASSSNSTNKTDGGASASGGTGACASQPTFLLCFNCCNPPKSYFDGQTAIANCICDTACKTECASSCAASNPTDPTPACSTCADSDATHTTCAPKGQALCDADPACKAYQACADAAKCDNKGDDDDAGSK